MKKDIRKQSRESLLEWFQLVNQPSYRLKQLEEWIWNKNAHSFDEMSNLPESLRNQLETYYSFYKIEPSVVQKSEDGTIKIGFKLHDERLIEGVMIPTEKRNTACVSSQVGCILACKFCATARLKRERNLDAAEIFDQVVFLNNEAKKQHGRGLTNIVYMGMGEPLLNYDNVIKSIYRICSPNGLHMAARRITVSTVGIARGIKRLADEEKKFNLALSLHAPTDEQRNQIMDINKSNPISALVEAMKYFYQKTGNKITFEYILLRNFNDSLTDAKNLITICKQAPAFVNLIEYNKVDGLAFKKTQPFQRDLFVKELEQAGISVKVRRSRGKDIDAACGQLANKKD